MKDVFVIYEEVFSDGSVGTGWDLIFGEDAESPEAFISSMFGHLSTKVKVLCWFEVPSNWQKNSCSGSLNAILEAIINLDALSDGLEVTRLFATIFYEGYMLGRKKNKKESDLADAIRSLINT